MLKNLRKSLPLWLMLAGLAFSGPAASETDDDVLTALLHEFLAGASKGDAAVHDRFWAEDLIYTSSSGSRTNKAEILASMAESPPDEEPAVLYTAEDIEINVFDDAAIIAFRLIGKPQGDGNAMHYFNTGTFINRDGVWKAVAWQATRIPEADPAN